MNLKRFEREGEKTSGITQGVGFLGYRHILDLQQPQTVELPLGRVCGPLGVFVRRVSLGLALERNDEICECAGL
jgi:hypothetical protein